MNLDEIITRVKGHAGVKKDKDLCENVLNIKQSRFSRRKKRGTAISFFIDWAIENGFSLNWVILGIGPKRSEKTLSDTEQRHRQLIKKFNNPEEGLKLNLWLTELQKHPDLYKEAIKSLETLYARQTIRESDSKKAELDSETPAPGSSDRGETPGKIAI